MHNNKTMTNRTVHVFVYNNSFEWERDIRRRQCPHPRKVFGTKESVLSGFAVTWKAVSY